MGALATDPRLVRRLASHLSQMAPHQRRREQGKLLKESHTELLKADEIINAFLVGEGCMDQAFSWQARNTGLASDHQTNA